MHPLRATSKECPRSQSSRRFSRSRGMRQSRTGQTSMRRVWRMGEGGVGTQPMRHGDRSATDRSRGAEISRYLHFLYEGC
jgi:hypothetical protein